MLRRVSTSKDRSLANVALKEQGILGYWSEYAASGKPLTDGTMNIAVDVRVRRSRPLGRTGCDHSSDRSRPM